MQNLTNTVIISSLVCQFAAIESSFATMTAIARWTFDNNYNFASNPTHQSFVADDDLTEGPAATLTSFRGNPDDLDDNGGGGNLGFVSSVDGSFHAPTRTLKWDDLKGSGSDFSIAGVSTFIVDKGLGALAGEDFSNDALIYIALDLSNFKDLEIRFDVEGTPGDLPTSFDLFYRIGGVGNTWFRDAGANNMALNFQDYVPVDMDNQFANSGQITLNSLLDNASQVEIILNDFSENGNNEMEIDNVEISGNLIPEPNTAVFISLSLLLGTAVNRHRH